ncbi:hypothetical protein [Haloprofundus salinisoli]|uniref:hypothetical protein n=1 Tax=Haloprofundus salinisoli TaxID=2876193 RepID=UPI001CCB40D8|nr:hypothetical protein [Haloprofundus salinisoli]
MATIDYGVIISSIFALTLLGIGVSGFINPRLQGGRDLNIIESEEVGPGEKFGARVFGTILIIMGLIISYFVLNSLFDI